MTTKPPTTPDPIDLLLDRLDDPDWQARAVAALALGASRQGRVSPALVDTLATDEAWAVRAGSAAGRCPVSVIAPQ